MSREHPVYFNPEHKDPLDKAKDTYFHSKKGKAALRKAQRKPHNTYMQSDKGKQVLRKHYEEKVKPKLEAVKACKNWMKAHPGKTVNDYLVFLAEQANGN